MGLSSILGTVLKIVSVEQIAGLLMAHGPELFRKAKERFQNEAEPAAGTPVETELQARLTRLEALLLEQEKVIRELAAKNIDLQEKSVALESRVLTFKIISAALFLAALTMLVILLKQL